MNSRKRTSGKCLVALRAISFVAAALVLCSACGCKSPAKYRVEADKLAAKIITNQQKYALGRTEPFTIEKPADTLRRRLLKAQGLAVGSEASLGADMLTPIDHWPEKQVKAKATTQPVIATVGNEPVRLTLFEALRVAARNNREYQSYKEDIFRAALALDLESNDFRNTYAALVRATISHDGSAGAPTGGVVGETDVSWSKRFKSGAAITGRLGVDLVRLLTGKQTGSMGIFADASISVPLLRGAGRHIITEPLTQAQRNVIYSIYTFERFKRTLAVRVATGYLNVLKQLDRIANARDNYRGLQLASNRARRRADAGRLSEMEADQARQNELSARDRWVLAQDSYQRSLDSLKLILGLPTDARITLDKHELDSLSSSAEPAIGSTTGEKIIEPGAFEMRENEAIALALDNRLDFRINEGRVFDAQRAVVVAADGLKADLTLTGSASMSDTRSLSSSNSNRGQLRPERGQYSASLSSNLPWDRTSERNTYRNSYILLERAIRNVQNLEDQIKLQVRNSLRKLRQARESYRIQAISVDLAQRRVDSTKMFIDAGRAQIRDVLDAQESLISAQNSLTSALVDYRIAELELQRDMGVLKVDEKGLWCEHKPGQSE
ncbi:MAG: TolC family protein [Planctomycetes bacterium]|nr:TolC family protein [Planctomycetota bacterium]